MSARWKRSNKNRKWVDLNELASKPKKSKSPQNHPKSTTSQSSYRPSASYKKKFQEPKPLIDIFQDNDNIYVVAEIAGFNKDTLKINVKDQKLTLSAKSKERRYYKSLNLPKVVIPDAMHTKYKNGVLEIKLKKVETSIGKEAD